MEIFKRNQKIIGILVIAFLFILGIIHWLSFFNFGDLSFSAYDWPKEIRCYSVLEQAIRQGIIPYNVSRALPYDATNRFLALPEIITSPQLILLKVMSIGNFIVLNTILMYAIGFIGCLLIKKRYNLSLIPFTILYLLFNFNGHITSHIAIGHSMWNGYFLLPFFCLFLFELIEQNAKNNNAAIKISLILFAIILQGTWHLFVWCILFMLFLAIFERKYTRQVASAIILSVLLSLFKLLPAAITFYNKGYRFMSGYPNLRDLFDALTLIRDHTFVYAGGILASLGSWECDIYIGILGLAFIAYFGFYVRFKNDSVSKNYTYKKLDWPIGLMSLFSISCFYAFIAMLPIPLLNSERVPSRFLILPLVVMVIISCINMQKLIHLYKNLSKVIKFVSIAALLQVAFSLMGHSKVWRIASIEKSFANEMPDFTISIIQQPDAFYKSIFWFSSFVSLFVFVILVLFYIRSLVQEK
ncbi:MAG: hypothetical protein JW946_04540 [Candidatus Omnitrophica bacterium]|nr:hypothetical protein [Candidatus Omnitrophota bacterium]